jgi:hypothetical protein
LFSKDKDPILGELIIEVHDYDENEEVLNVQALREALETSAQQHMEDTLQAVEDKEQCEQTDDESQDKQDPVNIHIQNSLIRTSPTVTPLGLSLVPRANLYLYSATMCTTGPLLSDYLPI